MEALFGIPVEIDREATRCWYAAAGEWGCTCGPCQNFLTLARERKLPEPVLECLDRLGIPPEKATYVCALYSDGEGDCYQFSYRIAGRLLREPETVQTAWGTVWLGHDPYPYGAPGFPEPHFDLEFSVVLPV